MYTKGQLSEFWDAILMSSTSKNVLQKFTRNLMGPSNAKKGADGYTYYATWTDFFLDNMISPNYFENMFVQTYGTVGWWLEKCGICFAIFLFPKLIIDIIVTVMRTSEVHLITGISVSFEKKSASISNLQPFYGFNFKLNHSTNQNYRKLSSSGNRNSGAHGGHLVYSNTTQ